MTVQSDHNESKIKTCPGWTKSYFKQPKSDYQIFITQLNNRCKQHYQLPTIFPLLLEDLTYVVIQDAGTLSTQRSWTVYLQTVEIQQKWKSF